ncbi:hypothetical protein [Nocardiopsis sp. YSL2]|uniref:hypothetical protein n=1 Tax=Nocardiopsis sp. YSL2 TaxID=2939492 RepID=UPI0026F45E08|nr:hypothetical protein [Nocardiopsis sp. YSL2]
MKHIAGAAPWETVTPVRFVGGPLESETINADQTPGIVYYREPETTDTTDFGRPQALTPSRRPVVAYRRLGVDSGVTVYEYAGEYAGPAGEVFMSAEEWEPRIVDLGEPMHTIIRPADHAVRLVAHHIHATGGADDPWEALTLADRINENRPLRSDMKRLTPALLAIAGDHVPDALRAGLDTHPQIALPRLVDMVRALLPHLDIPHGTPIPADTQTGPVPTTDAMRWTP